MLHSFAVAILCMIIFVEFGYIVIESFRRIFGFDARFTAALITFIGTVWATLYVQSSTKRREIEARLFPEKSAAYDIIITIITDLISQTRTKKIVSEPELVERMLQFKKKLLVWAATS